jgi:hypothetical protein
MTQYEPDADHGMDIPDEGLSVDEGLLDEPTEDDADDAPAPEESEA